MFDGFSCLPGRQVVVFAIPRRCLTEGKTIGGFCAIVFRPSPDSMNQNELLNHIYRLVSLINYTLGGKQSKPIEVDSPMEIRHATLMKILEAKRRLEKMDSSRLYNCNFYIEYYDKTFPVWSMVNGPLCDALTHVGQIVSWRRLNGKPVLGANVLHGEPPR